MTTATLRIGSVTPWNMDAGFTVYVIKTRTLSGSWGPTLTTTHALRASLCERAKVAGHAVTVTYDTVSGRRAHDPQHRLKTVHLAYDVPATEAVS